MNVVCFDNVTIRVDESAHTESDCKELLKKLFFTTSADDLTCRPMSGGQINHMIHCHVNYNDDTDDDVVIRIHHDKQQQHEYDMFMMLGRHHLAPRVLARFHNGLVYRYVRGRSLTIDELRSDEMAPQLAAELAKWHQVPLSDFSG